MLTMLRFSGFLAFIMLAAVSCNDEASSRLNTEKENFVAEADSIAIAAQRAFITKLTGALEGGGAEHAVDFCNLAAVELTSALSTEYGVEIHRLSEKNRNPANGLQTQGDHDAWEYFLRNQQAEHFTIGENENMVVYKPIKIGMPTCLECHGMPNTDILPQTLARIRDKYPDDKATGYELGMLRGMWKIEKPANLKQ